MFGKSRIRYRHSTLNSVVLVGPGERLPPTSTGVWIPEGHERPELSRSVLDEPDFRVRVNMMNDHVARRMVELRMANGEKPSVEQLLERMGYGWGTDSSAQREQVRQLVGLRMVPTNDEGAWKSLAVEIAGALESSPDDLWPGLLKTRVPHEAACTFKAYIGEPKSLLVMSKYGC